MNERAETFIQNERLRLFDTVPTYKINLKSIIKSMIILFSFILMTGFVLMYIDYINKTSTKKIIDSTSKLHTDSDYIMIHNDVYGINDAINGYYKVEGGYMPPEYRNNGKTFSQEDLNQFKQDRLDRSNRWYDDKTIIPESSITKVSK